MKYNMIQNALDSLNEAVEYYLNGKKYSDKRCYKYCIIMLYHTAELLMEEKLYREHPVLICEKIEDYDRNRVLEKTIGFNSALQRLTKICNCDIGHYYNNLRNLSIERNKIQHYEIDIEVNSLINIIIASFSSIEYLLYNVLEVKYEDYEEYISIEQINILHNDKEARKKRREDIFKDISAENLKREGIEYLENKHISFPCPCCGETEVVVCKNNRIECLFCGEKYINITELYKKDKNCIISEFMERELGRRKHLLSYLSICPHCNYKALIDDPATGSNICASCGKHFSETDLMEIDYQIRWQGYEDWIADAGDILEDYYNH